MFGLPAVALIPLFALAFFGFVMFMTIVHLIDRELREKPVEYVEKIPDDPSTDDEITSFFDLSSLDAAVADDEATTVLSASELQASLVPEGGES